MFDALQSEARVFAEVHERRQQKSTRLVGYWLVFMALLIAVMVMVGGATRLTESGLSMVDWRPVTGFVPPLSEADWAAEFEKYKSSPEYKIVNRGMSLDDFKTIYHWEFWHRNLGRFIGIAFAVPFLAFLAAGKIPKALFPRLVLLLFLGGAQGALGWYMVKSGLVQEPAVSHFRLAAHLCLALLLFSAILWTALSLLTSPALAPARPVVKAAGWAFLGLLALQIVYGAFVAGLDAGHAYNTWPDMDGALVPETAFRGDSIIERTMSGTSTVQFMHRGLAYGVGLFALLLGLLLPRALEDRPASNLAPMLLLVVGIQIAIGIATLLMAVPVWLGTLHQGWAVVVLGTTIALLHRMRTPKL